MFARIDSFQRTVAAFGALMFTALLVIATPILPLA